MIATDERRAVFWLHQKGMKTREIARRLTLNRNTVRTIIRQGGTMPERARVAKQQLDETSLRQLYQNSQNRIAELDALGFAGG